MGYSSHAVRTIKIFCCITILFCLVLSGCEKKTEPSPDYPRLTTKVTLQDVTFHSAALERDMQYRVILPAKINNSQKFPAIYLLHGKGENFRTWTNYSDVARFAEQGFILVMPEGNISYYTNAVDRPKDRYEDYIVNDLIHDVESRFPVIADHSHRAIIGISMGGYGSIKTALKHPDLYAFAAGMSSALDVPSRPFSLKRFGQYMEHRKIFGPLGNQTRRDNDPLALVLKVNPEKMPYIFLTCGDQEGLLVVNRKFARLLAERHFEYQLHVEPGGHNWNQWNRILPDVFASLSAHLNH